MKTTIFIFVSVFLTGFCFAQNNPPVALNDTAEAISQIPVLIDVLVNDYDPDGDAIIIRDWSSPRQGVADTIDGKIRYKSHNYSGKDSIRYRIRDNGIPGANSNYAWIHIHVLNNPDAPLAQADTFELLQRVPAHADIILNDNDPNGDEIKIYDIFNVFNCEVIVDDDSSAVTIIPSLTSGYFFYRIIEKNTAGNFISNSAMVSIYIIENPDIPVAENDEAFTIGGMPVEIPVLANDYDPQGDLIEILDFTEPNHGIVSRYGDVFLYVPEISFTGTDEFMYRVREIIDTAIYTDYAQVMVIVSKNPDCPVGVPDNASGTTFIEMTIDVLSNDYDINGDPFELWQVTGSSTSSISINNNLIKYTSSPLTLNKDSVFYKIRQTNDTLYHSEWTKVLIDLAANPNLPVAINDYFDAHAGLPATVFPLENDIPNNADSLIIFFAGNGKKGIVTLRTDSTITYVPYCRSSGIDSITYGIRDKSDFLLMATGKIFFNINDQRFYDSLEINNINAGVNANGGLFSSINEIHGQEYMSGINGHFRFPKGELKNTIFTSRLWIGGLDSQGNLHLGAERYKQVGMDFQAGPISNNYDTDHYLKYGRTWKIHKDEIEYHRNNYWKNGYQPIEAIASWPGNGNLSLGEAERLAPFRDMNNDGIYNPLDGDYPLIRGDQTIYIMYNDDLDHTETQGNRLKIEIHAMIYGFNSPQDSALNNSIFVHYDLINRSDLIYYDTYAGIFSDMDIGYAWDDYIGCDVTRGSFYCYNGIEIDGNGEPDSYGINPPAQSVTVLAGPFLDADGADNPSGNCDEGVNGLNFGNGTIDDERHGLSKFVYFSNTSSNPATTDPSIASEYYSFLKGLWKDLTPISYGGNAHQSGGAVGPQCRFVFPGDSDPVNWGTDCEFPNNGYNQNGKYWTEEETGNVPGDRRGLGVMGPFTFKPGDVQEIELAFCAANGWAGPLSSLDQLMQNINSLNTAINNGEIIIPNNNLSISEGTPDNIVLKVIPNPAYSHIHIIFESISHDYKEYSIFDLPGNLCISGVSHGADNIKIDIGHLNPGFYIIIIKTNNGIAAKKFIKI